MVEKLKTLMKYNNLSQKQLAKKLGTNEVFVSRFLNGKRKPTIEFALKVSEAFSVSLDWLLK